jgi:hypothetical protein
MLWILKWQGTLKSEVVKKASWIIGGVIFALTTIFVSIAFVPWRWLVGHARTDLTTWWDLYWNTVPYPGAVAIGAILLAVVVVLLARKSKTKTHAPAASSHGHGGSGSHESGAGKAVGLVIVVILGLMAAYAVAQEWHQETLRVTRSHTTGNRVEIIIAPTGPNNLASYYVPSGMTMWWLERTPEHILVHREGEPEMESSRDQTLRLTPRSGPYRFFARAKGDKPVEVEIHLEPARL